jgi:hypothetical protein
MRWQDYYTPSDMVVLYEEGIGPFHDSCVFIAKGWWNIIVENDMHVL